MAYPVVLTPDSLSAVESLLQRCAASTVLGALGGVIGGSGAGKRFAFDFIIRELETGRLEAIGIIDGGDIRSILLWKMFEWDTEILGKKCARLLFVGGSDAQSLLSFWKKRAVSMGTRYVTMRIPECIDAEAGSTAGRLSRGGPEEGFSGCVCYLEAEGFSWLERLCFLKRGTRVPEPLHEVVEAEPEALEEIMDVAGSSYSFDRFHREPLFSKRDADRVHMVWARDSFLRDGSAVLVVRGSRRGVSGYVSCVLPGSPEARHGWIDMLAVRREQRRKGIGTSLLHAALQYFLANGLQAGALSTQDNNEPALGLYRKFGFIRYGTALTYRLAL